MKRNDPNATLTGYLDRVNQHDVSGALEHVSDDFELEFVGGPTLTKGGLRNALGWDAGTRGKVEWRVVSSGNREITIEGEETNEFLRLLGVKPVRFRSTYRFNEAGLINWQQHEVDWTGANVEEAMAPALGWAAARAPEELAEAYPEGRMTYSEEAGRRWVDLLERWRQATESE